MVISPAQEKSQLRLVKDCRAEYVSEQDMASASGHLVADSLIHMGQMK